MDRRMRWAVLLFSLTLMALPCMADTILPPGATWEYTFTNPTGVSNWNKTTGGWATGPAPFGNYISTGPSDGYDPNGYFNYKTLWPADSSDGYDLWVRTAIDLTGYDLSSVIWNLGVDNGFALYINGNLVASANGEGYTYRWEYNGNFMSYLTTGINIVAVALEDHGGLTAFDMQVTGNQSVPEPSIITLLGIAIGAITLKSWRQSR